MSYPAGAEGNFLPGDEETKAAPQILIIVEGGVIENIYADRPVVIKVLDLDSQCIGDDLLTDREPDSSTPEDFALMLANAEAQQRAREKEREEWSGEGKGVSLDGQQ